MPQVSDNCLPQVTSANPQVLKRAITDQTNSEGQVYFVVCKVHAGELIKLHDETQAICLYEQKFRRIKNLTYLYLAWTKIMLGLSVYLLCSRSETS